MPILTLGNLPFPMNDIALVLALTGFWFIIARWWRQRPLPFHPGPKPRLVVGSMFDMPTVRPWEKYREWCETYSQYLNL